MLFGEKYVELIDPPNPAAAGLLKPDSQIPEERTIAPFELEEVLRTLQPVLDATSPGDLGGALHALAEGLAGQEDEARRTIDNALIVLRTLAGTKPDLDRLLGGVDEGSDAFARAMPDLVAALDDLDRVNQTLLAHSDDLKAVLHDAPDWLEVAEKLVEDRYTDLVDLSVKGADVLDLVASHRTELPSAVRGLKNFTQDWVTNLSTPCEDANGLVLGTAAKHPELAGSTCWQVWIVSAEKNKSPGGYGPEGPQPGTASAAAAYHAQLRQMMRLPFGVQPSSLAILLNAAIRDQRGLIPEELL
jgi:ABC-type transporter Mla subunit MlaD